ncbi:carbohydrate ABC transporter permease [Actinoplanes sp. NPDC051470]|uniref:carbohydrate ABC transporter permease n=1 Tax=unclassified Actinoplanes TaxID=2626549 RepID=UPI0034235D69
MSRLSLTARQVLLCLATVAALAPLVFMVLTSLKTSADYTVNPAGPPASITFDNYRRALTDLPTLRWMLNSLLVTTVSVAASTVVAVLGAYAISFGRFRGRQLLLGLNIGLIMVPPVVLLLPVFVIMVNLRLINTLPSVMLFYTGLLVPFAVFFLTSFFRSVPYDVIHAAQVDGAGPGRTLWSVILPLTRPALMTVGVVNAIWVWNELLISLVFLQGENQRTLMGGLSLSQGRYATDQPLVLAVATLSILPVAAFYALSQRSFVRGLTAGIGK